MKLQIGERLKALRQERGVTQEKLAEALNVTCQSVSRWELAVCYPDIEQLPAIANYFDVTLDDLLGMSRIRSEQTRSAIFTRALNLERLGDWDAAIAVLRDALGLYPNDDALSAELALALGNTGRRADCTEAVSLCEQVLQRSTDEKLCATVRAALCFLLRAAGQPEKALALARTLPHIWECREVLLPALTGEADRGKQLERSFSIAAQVLRDAALAEQIPFSLGYRFDDGPEGRALLRFCRSGAEEPC